MSDSDQATVHQVADYFLTRSGPLTHMKLQKLCYYAQGFYLAFRREPLFGEPLRAWAYGPVVRELWDRFRYTRSFLDIPEDSGAEAFTPEQRKFLGIVLARFGEYPAIELSRMTHEEAPWRDAYERRKHSWDDVITHESLIEWFGPRFVELDTAEAPAPPSEELVRQVLGDGVSARRERAR